VISFGKRAAPLGRGVILALTPAFACALAQVTALGQAVEEGIERARADRVTVAAKFFDETQAVNVLLARVVQHMKLYQAAPEVAMVVSPMDTHPAELISSGHCARRNIIRSRTARKPPEYRGHRSWSHNIHLLDAPKSPTDRVPLA
jgi:hypothetical protein